MLDKWVEWSCSKPEWINLNNGSILLLGSLLGIMIIMEIISHLRGNGSAFF